MHLLDLNYNLMNEEELMIEWFYHKNINDCDVTLNVKFYSMNKCYTLRI